MGAVDYLVPEAVHLPIHCCVHYDHSSQGVYVSVQCRLLSYTIIHVPVLIVEVHD